mgnify:CR=1 FL=1
MAKKKSKPVEKIRLSGRNIYTDKKGRVIFYDMITKKGYLVDKKHENSALFFKNRFVVLLFAAILFGATFLTWLQAAVAWAVMMAIAEFAFRRGFLKKLEVVNDVDFERRVSALQYIVENKAKGKVIVLIVSPFSSACNIKCICRKVFCWVMRTQRRNRTCRCVLCDFAYRCSD